MSLFYLAWKNLSIRPARFLFVVLLMSVAASLSLLILLVNEQFSQHLGKSSENIDLILCSKGSPLQSVMCNVMYVDAPTGNISSDEIKPFLNPKHPVIESSIPISSGDSYEDYRIIGTTLEYFSFMQLQLSEGSFFVDDFDVVLGSEVAKLQKLKIGDKFQSNHGLVKEDASHEHEQQLIVKGILFPSGTIKDRLIFTNISSYWSMHHDEKEEENKEELDHHEFGGLPQNVNSLENLRNSSGEITALLLKFKGNNIQALNFGRNINQNTGLMAVNPAIEISRLYELSGSASELFNIIGWILGLLATFAIIINLFQAFEERKIEMAIMRLGGAGKVRLFTLMMLEGLIISIIGISVAFLIAHGSLEVASVYFKLGEKYNVTGKYFSMDEMKIIAGGLLIAAFSAIWPAVKAYRQDLHRVISSID